MRRSFRGTLDFGTDGLVSIGGAFLVVTGLALAMRRLRAWLANRVRSTKPRLGEISPPVPGSAGD